MTTLTVGSRVARSKSRISRVRTLGYEVHHRVLNTRHFGLPQYRERIYIVGFRDPHPSFAFPEETEERPTLLTLRNLYDGETMVEHFFWRQGFFFFACEQKE
jgi:site-specific DNA-cytosine methylase